MMNDPMLPPAWMLRILEALCPAHLYEAIEGDLLQKFQRDLKQHGTQNAKRKFLWNAIGFLRPGILLRTAFSYPSNHSAMFQHYVRTAIRYLQRHKGFSGINLAGLAIGMCVCFFALLYVNFELSYDTYHEKADRIYRLVTDVKTPTGTVHESSTGPMAALVRENFPEAEAVTHIFLDYLIIQKDPDHFGEEKIAYADTSLFSVFTFPLIRGDRATLLSAPKTIVLSETAARKYFGEEDPIGKALFINGDLKEPAFVTGVMKDIPHNSHFRVDMLVSKSTLGESWMHNWKRFFFYTYLLLPQHSDPAALSEKITKLARAHTDHHQGRFTLLLEPLKDIYFHSEPRGSRTGSAVSGNIMNVYIFSSVSIFVLAIACFNFINLTTALSMNRAKEVGIRKVVGAAKCQLTFQFLIDAVLLSLLAFLCALAMCAVLLPLFNELSGKVIALGIFHEPRYIGWLFASAVLIGLLSGIYPAFVLSGFRPVSSLNGRFAGGSKGIVLRRALVITQFSISIALIVSTLVVYSQLDYMRNHSPGFKKDHRLVIDFQFDGRISTHREAVKHQLSGLRGAGMASVSSGIPGRANHTFTTSIENSEKEMPELQWDAYFVDYDFLTQYGINVIAGRGFSRDFPADTTDALLINEAAARSLGYVNPQDAIGKPFTQLRRRGYIVGVVSDFHYHSFQEKVQPLTLALGSGFLTFLTLDIATSNTQEIVHAVEDAWEKIAPGMPLIYFFADEAYNAQYAGEERFGKLFLCLAVIAISVSCLGLSGLSAYSIAQRTKEIGIRKILGSSLLGIVNLLTKDFIKLIAFAILVGSPLAWLGMRRWLEDFAYRIDVSWWMFVAAGVAVILIAFTTISILAIKAARTNPINSLRSE